MSIEIWKPLEINEFDEMERIQSLKQRENLLKGMGITDFVYKMLFGTSGTIATLPPAMLANVNHSGQSNNNDQSSQNDNQSKTNPNKFEIKTKNYNPFENHSSFAEVFFIIINLLCFS